MDGRWARVMPNINFWMTGCSVLQSVDTLHSIDNVITATVKNCCPEEPDAHDVRVLSTNQGQRAFSSSSSPSRTGMTP
eukprot:scaffold11854_cov77-Phaeocystis_antarctica.AAC.1